MENSICSNERSSVFVSLCTFCDYVCSIRWVGSFETAKTCVTIQSYQNYHFIAFPIAAAKMSLTRVTIFNLWHRFLMQPVDNVLTSITTYYILFHTLVFLIVSSAVFVYQNWWQTESALRTCIAVVGGCQVAGMFISHVLKMDKIKEFHRKLQGIREENDYGNLSPASSLCN